MTINFSVGNFVIPNQAYVTETLQDLATSVLVKQQIELLGALIGVPCEVTATGNLTFPSRSYITLLPTDTRNKFYNSGNGATAYFASDTALNNAFELSGSYLRDKRFIKVLNNSGDAIAKSNIVRQTGFDATNQLPTIDAAEATSEVLGVVLGATMEEIANGATGTVLVAGSFDADTTLFSLNDPVYLSDSKGAISASPGTFEIIVGRVLVAGTSDGSISLQGSIVGGYDPSAGIGKQTIWIPAAAMKATVTAGCSDLTSVETTAGNPDLIVMDYDPDTEESSQFQVGFPKQWNKGTISYQVFWTVSGDTSSDSVIWGLQGVAVSDSGAIDVAYGSAALISDSNDSAAEDLLVSAESASLTIGGTPADDDICYFRFYRDATNIGDDLNADARLIGVKLFFVNEKQTDD
jgi:hypothetical protein